MTWRCTCQERRRLLRTTRITLRRISRRPVSCLFPRPSLSPESTKPGKCTRYMQPVSGYTTGTLYHGASATPQGHTATSFNLNPPQPPPNKPRDQPPGQPSTRRERHGGLSYYAVLRRLQWRHDRRGQSSDQHPQRDDTFS